MDHYSISLLKEKVDHGDLMFPMQLYATHLDHKVSDLCLHWHEEFEIIYVICGEGTFQINLQPYPIKKGDMLIIPPGSIHSATNHETTDFQFNAIVFHLDMLKSASVDSVTLAFINPLIHGEMTSPIVLHPEDEHYEILQTTYTAITKAYALASPVYQLEIKGLLFRLFALLYGHDFICTSSSHETASAIRIEKIKIVIEYILKHYNEELPITDLAHLLQYSDYHFIRFFKEQTGSTCTQYINTIRLQKACELLLSSSLSITDIALDVGFQNISYFIRLFKSKYLCTPNTFRKKFSPKA